MRGELAPIPASQQACRQHPKETVCEWADFQRQELRSITSGADQEPAQCMRDSPSTHAATCMPTASDGRAPHTMLTICSRRCTTPVGTTNA